MALLRRLMGGAAAGAAGTTALNAVTYLDMAVRGRPPSTLPDEMAGRLADRLGLDLGDGVAARHRRSALGALLGTAAGVGIGAAYGALGVRPSPLRLAVAATLAGNGPLVAAGLTDPREWGAVGWLSDIVPHVAYGAAAGATLRALRC